MTDTDALTSGFLSGDEQHILDTEEKGPAEDYYTSKTGMCRILRQRRYGRVHLLKTLKAEFRGQEFFEAALQKEFQIGYQLQHEHICRTMGWEQVEGTGPCIVMEYIDGITLQQLMAEGRLTRPLARQIALETCSALSYMHSKQVIHRDLKPSNIMITHAGQHVKLIDFGLSDSGDYAILKYPAGTPFYMAPEVRSQENGETGRQGDGKADIYSLGIIMAEMARLTGDSHMQAVAARCSKTNPAERYETVSAVRGALSRQPRHLWPWVAAAIGSAAVVAALLLTGQPTTSTPPRNTPQGHGNTVLSPQLLSALRQQQAADHRDTTLLRQALDREFPTPQLRQSPLYEQQWRTLLSLLDDSLKAAP